MIIVRHICFVENRPDRRACIAPQCCAGSKGHAKRHEGQARCAPGLAKRGLCARIIDYVPRHFVFFLLFCFSKTAGGGREALYAVKNHQIPKKPPASLGGFFVPHTGWQTPWS
ncbi:hypothetical protein ERD78_09490 [Allopusillimonas soli]|uniref:Uncharacterized protein n=1 Tax=Allopusillimonas soli TaxID=659016 RepID=A0A853F8W7_9BURK|nr:hypothetical protein [Allopusillimonas soli]NYT37105.1 hypothetical protein [Allopusillimonas soli]TEA75538.1 hypothetical protein ERD78_09490 [Allopusillimonas soli]